MDASTADRPVTLTGLAQELVLHILSFLDRPTMFQLTLVCRHFSTFVQPHGLHCAWNTIRRWETQEDVLELPRLDSLPRALLYDVCFRVFGSCDHRTQRLLNIGVNFQKAPQVFERLLEDTFRKLGDGRETQLLRESGAGTIAR
jgi:hypothetical protein